MRYLSVCSGIEAATVAWHQLGWLPVAVSEIEPFPSAVLAHHYPTVPNLGDMTKFKDWPDADIDLLVGGTPCQSFSVAGLRKGLDDPRGSLMLTYLAIARRYSPEWLVWENVPGVLSADGGRAFGSLLGGLAELGYGFAYRVLDAQYFGLAQRRQRVFVVGCLGDWRRAAAVLFERESLSGHPAPSREAGQRVAPTIGGCSNGGGANGPGRDVDSCESLIPSTGDISHCLNAGGMGRIDYETETLIAHALRGEGFDASEDGTGRGTPLVPVANTLNGYAGRNQLEQTYVPIAFSAKDYGADAGDIAPTLRAGGHVNSHANAGVMPAIAFDARQSDVIQYGDMSGPLDTDGHTIGIGQEDYAGAYEADSSSVLRTLRETVGAKAVAEWGSRILDSLQSPEVLRSWLHGASLRLSSDHFRSFVGNCPLPREEGAAAATLRQVWQEGPDGRSPQGRGLAKQLAQQLGKALPELPHKGASRTMRVRRLTPLECERLMGFPDDYTLIPYRGKPASDGPRYKALGNSMAVPCMAWLGRRIEMVNAVRGRVV
jgi:DNA (cytosine-5)-methyltransferase 1